MLINSKDFNSDQLYFLMIQTIIPRPIAWVLSDNGNQTYNLAPFSFFNAVCSNPPIIMISMGWKDETTKKDTWLNIDHREHFVVHIASAEHAHDVSNSSASLAFGESEVNKFLFETEKLDGWPLPKLKKPKVALLCKKYAIHELGPDPQALILGEVTSFWIDDKIITLDNKQRIKIDPFQLNPLGRLGGPEYILLGEKITIPRPK